MEYFDIEKIVLLALVFVPGFVFLKAKKNFIAEHKTDFSKDLYEAIGISLINLILFSPLLYYFHSNSFTQKNTYLVLIIISLSVVIIPFFESYLFSKILKSKFIKKHFRTANKKPWDDFFEGKKSYWVIVTLKSGRRIGGLFATESYVSEFPEKHEIYLEKVYVLDENDGFSEKNRTAGIIITEDEISTIEFIN